MSFSSSLRSASSSSLSSSLIRVLKITKSKSSLVFFSHSSGSSNNPLILGLPPRLSRAFNSSCQPSMDVTESLDGETHDDLQPQSDGTITGGAQQQQKLFGLRPTTKQVQQVHTKGVPLREVVAHCVKHTFKDYLKKANAGDVDAQLTIGQMLCSGYGVEKDTQKGKDWIEKAEWKRKSQKLTKGVQVSKSKDDDYFFI